MAGELHHVDPGPVITQAEYIAPSGLGGHTVDGGANGDLLQYNGTAVVRLAAGANGTVLTIVAGVPAWGTVSSVAFPLLAPNGSAGAPSYSFSSFPTWGMTFDSGYGVVIGTAGVLTTAFTTTGPTLPAAGSLSWSANAFTGALSQDLFLYRDAANVLAQRNSTNAQAFRIYNTYTDASNYEYGSAQWTSGEFRIGTTRAGTGVARPVVFMVNAVARFYIETTGHFLAYADNTYDIGASGATRPRNIFVGTNITVGGVVINAVGSAAAPSYTFTGVTTTGLYTVGSNVKVTNGGVDSITLGQNFQVRAAASIGWSSTTDSSAAADVVLWRDAANTLAQRNGTTAQDSRVYNTWTDAANNEYGRLTWSGNIFYVGTVKNGSGSDRAMTFTTGGSGRWTISSTGHFLADTDNTYDIGASGATRPRNIFVGTNVTIGGVSLGANGLVSAPTYSFSTGTNTGFYTLGAGSHSIVAASNGIAQLDIDPNSVRLLSTVALGWSSGNPTAAVSDVVLLRDAANTLAQRNGTTAQTSLIYGTWTDASNYERLAITVSTNMDIVAQQIGTGTARSLRLRTSGATALTFGTNDTFRWQIDASGHFVAISDNAYDIGASGATRPRNLYVANAATINILITTLRATLGPSEVNRSVTNSTNSLNVFNGTAPSGTLANGATFYAQAGEMWVMNAAGTPTQLSPHDAEGNWWFNSQKNGKKLEIDVEKILRFVNDKYGLDMVRELELAGA